MRNSYCLKLLILSLNLTFAFTAMASQDTTRENCTYNGVILDTGASPETATRKNKIPETFSGHVVCFRVPEGTKQEEMVLKDGKREGKYRHFDFKGRVDESTMYKNGIKDGEAKRFHHKNGVLQSIMNYKNGALFGIQKDYDTDSGALERLYFINLEGKVDTDIQFNPNGQPTSLTCGKKSVHPDDNSWCGRSGRGKVKLFHKDGSLRSTAEYARGYLDGKLVNYLDDETIETEIYSMGKLVSSKTIQDKKVIAASKSSSRGDNEEIEKIYFDGTKKLQADRKWENQKLIFEKIYWENGKLQKDWQRQKDDLVKITEYWENGKMKSEGTYKLRGQYRWSIETPDGIISYFDDLGIFSEIAEYKNGDRDGVTKYIYQGKLLRLEKYNKFLTYSEDYDKNEKLIRKTTYNSDGSRVSEIEVK
jgi:antitoxin component YwqK of YwqJK toxin-antitoxin module